MATSFQSPPSTDARTCTLVALFAQLEPDVAPTLKAVAEVRVTDTPAGADGVVRTVPQAVHADSPEGL